MHNLFNLRDTDIKEERGQNVISESLQHNHHCYSLKTLLGLFIIIHQIKCRITRIHYITICQSSMTYMSSRRILCSNLFNVLYRLCYAQFSINDDIEGSLYV